MYFFLRDAADDHQDGREWATSGVAPPLSFHATSIPAAASPLSHITQQGADKSSIDL